jgi:hypothetical protein
MRNTRLPKAASKTVFSRIFLALAPAVAVTAALTFSNPDRVIVGSFETALSALPAETRVSNIEPASISGSEEFWLNRDRSALAGMKTVAWSAPVAAGDHIRVRTGNTDRVYEVVSVAPVADASTRLETGNGAPKRFVLTCRNAVRDDGRLIELTVDGTGRELTVPAPAQAL